VLCLVFRSLENETVRYGKHGEAQTLDMRQDLDLFLIAEGPFGDIDDLSEIDCTEDFAVE
jgi:hypothetical protein